MNYTQKLTLSMIVPDRDGGRCRLHRGAGAQWLQGQARVATGEAMASHLQLGSALTAVLTLVCVTVCIGFTVWIRRTARAVLGGEPTDAQQTLPNWPTAIWRSAYSGP